MNTVMKMIISGARDVRFNGRNLSQRCQSASENDRTQGKAPSRKPQLSASWGRFSTCRTLDLLPVNELEIDPSISAPNHENGRKAASLEKLP
jgi:hypothetical protein